MAEQHTLGSSSQLHLAGTKDIIKAVVALALKKCIIDFSVVDGRRTFEEQRQNIINEVSWTMDSKHLPDETGLAGAVDIYPWVGGQTSHRPYFYKLIARAMFEAAIELHVRIQWGGLWSEEHEDKMHWELLDHVPLQEAA